MKNPIAASILILLVAALFGVSNHQRLVTIRESHAKLVAAAAQRGVSIDTESPDDPVRITKRDRKNKEADAKLAAEECIASAEEAMEGKGGPADEAQKERIMEIMDRIMSLDSSQLKFLIAEVRAAKDLSDETRKRLIGFSIMIHCSDHPQAALALFTESLDLFAEDFIGEQVVPSSLAKWAKDDPLAAMEWLKKNSSKFPDSMINDGKLALISVTAAQDPRLAFKFIGELGLEEVHQSISSIASAAKTPAERTATLTALREYLATLPEENAKSELSNAAMGSFASSLARSGFEAGTKWIAEAKFTPAELLSFTGGLQGSLKGDDNARWIAWIGEKLPPDNAAENIHKFVRNWTRRDYQAAGEWLTTAPAGPTKNAAIRSYAETVSKHEPETAAQWAMTLPPGNDRDQTLKNIYQKWPKDDTAAKEAFTQQHGIK